LSLNLYVGLHVGRGFKGLMRVMIRI